MTLESLLLLEAALTADTGLESPQTRASGSGFCEAGVTGCGKELEKGLPFGGGEKDLAWARLAEGPTD